MIYSDKQHTVSCAQLEKLKAALFAAENREVEHEWIRQAEIDAIKSQIADTEIEIAEYEQLKSGRVPFSKVYSLEELPRVLVGARIAAGLSQTNLAEKLNMKPQQIQRYEATNYMGASLAKLIDVSRALGVKTSGMIEGSPQGEGSIFAWAEPDDVAWGEFPYKEMIRRRWFDVPKGANPVQKLREYFISAAGPQFASPFHRKKMWSANVPNEYALLAWQVRVLERAKEFEARYELPEFQMDDRWLPDLVSLTKRRDGPKRARRFLAKKGIALVVERHLPGSYLDGAAMLSEEERPVIGLTLRYDRLDNFWFVLLHEIGHVFLHLFDGLRYDFFDEAGAADPDSIEAEADRFALNRLIPEAHWKQCLSRFALTDESVQIDAEKLGIHPSIVAGRIRKERGNYTILGDLVGQGEVREQLKDPDNDLE